MPVAKCKNLSWPPTLWLEFVDYNGVATTKRQGAPKSVKDDRGTDFQRRVLAIVRRIPVGRVATYGDVAEMAGRPRAWRAVGSIMRQCRDRSTPCHRVIAAGGALGGYGGNLNLKRALLRAEGLTVGLARVRRFDSVRWRGANKP
jgi:O-6-methylguanine DNA methyltransferase